MAVLPRPIRPMLATLRRSLPADQDRYGWEFKWDGVRAIADVSGGEVRLVSRNDKDMAASYPELAVLAGRVGAPVSWTGRSWRCAAGGRISGRCDPRNPARRLAAVRGFLRHLAAADGATEVPAPGLLGPAGHRKPPHVYSDREIEDLLQAAAGLAPPGGLRPHCYATLFGLIACTGLRICEALSLTCGDVDLAGGVLTIRAGKRGRTRLVPLHPSALAPLRDYAADRSRRFGRPGDGEAFFSTDRSDQVSDRAANNTFIVLRRQHAANTGHGQGRPCRATCARRQAACHRGSRPCQAGPIPGTPDPPLGTPTVTIARSVTAVHMRGSCAPARSAASGRCPGRAEYARNGRPGTAAGRPPAGRRWPRLGFPLGLHPGVRELGGAPLERKNLRIADHAVADLDRPAAIFTPVRRRAQRHRGLTRK